MERRGHPFAMRDGGFDFHRSHRALYFLVRQLIELFF